MSSGEEGKGAEGGSTTEGDDDTWKLEGAFYAQLADI